MVVVCPECSTRFSFEESRIPGVTAKVRCSRCRHVFRINREGQVVVSPKEPPATSREETPPQQEVAPEVSVPPSTETFEPPSALEEVKVLDEPTPQAREAAPVELPVTTGKRSYWLWLVALFLVVIVLGGVGVWVARQGIISFPLKSLKEAVQPLKKKEQRGPEISSSTPPAPVVVTPPPPLVPTPDLRDLPVDWAQGRYEGLVNAHGGQLLVIRGEVVNKGKSVRGPIRLKAILTDSQHRPLRDEIVYAGTTLTDEELKTLDPNKLKSWLTQPGGRSNESELKPGEKQPFTIVFFGVPPNLAETQSGFQLVVVEGPVIAGKSARK